MRINFWIFTLRHKAYWFWCILSAAHYADWKRVRQSSIGKRRPMHPYRMTRLH